jgi:hypothetical protein
MNYALVVPIQPLSWKMALLMKRPEFHKTSAFNNVSEIGLHDIIFHLRTAQQVFEDFVLRKMGTDEDMTAIPQKSGDDPLTCEYGWDHRAKGL